MTMPMGVVMALIPPARRWRAVAGRTMCSATSLSSARESRIRSAVTITEAWKA